MGGARSLAQRLGARRWLLRVVDLVEHEFSRDGRLGAVDLGGAALERRNHLLHHLIEENVRQLGMQERTKLEGDLWEEFQR